MLYEQNDQKMSKVEGRRIEQGCGYGDLMCRREWTALQISLCLGLEELHVYDG